VTDSVGVALLGTAHTTHAWSYARAVSAASTTRLVGVYEPTADWAASVCTDFDVPRCDDAAELVARSDVDAVVVCSPTVEHRSLVELAAQHGKHVLCEKPVATTVEDAEAMVQACVAADVQLHVAFVSRFLPLVQQAKAAVAAGELGQLIGLVGGNRGRPPLPPTYPGWITSREAAGGGALIDHSVHVTDAMRFISGLEVATVSAEVGTQMWDCGVDDLALLTLVFDSGAVGSVDPSWSVPEGNPWDYDFYLRLVGTGGSFDLDDLAESVQLVSPKWGGGLRLAGFAEDADQAMIDAFAASIVAGEVVEPSASGVDGLRALEIALAGYASAEQGQPVRLD
jgi:predicted dehydrogenase